MSLDHDPSQADQASSAWLDSVLRDDARREQRVLADAAFTSALMQSLPEQQGVNLGDVARFGLSALATAVAGLIVVENGAALLDNFAHALTTLRPDQMISSVAPFGMLLGLALFTFRLQTTER